jgi:hypothetical protein
VGAAPPPTGSPLGTHDRQKKRQPSGLSLFLIWLTLKALPL